MARPKKQRLIGVALAERTFKPQDGFFLKTDLKGDELEAMRLCDMDELYQERAARQMGISRRTLERILDSGRKKVIDALFHGKAIQISMPEYVLLRKQVRNGNN
jgi:predicted DNA-binding protein (UPF0251 family)